MAVFFVRRMTIPDELRGRALDVVDDPGLRFFCCCLVGRFGIAQSNTKEPVAASGVAARALKLKPDCPGRWRQMG
jgi:hypothetical protein